MLNEKELEEIRRKLQELEEEPPVAAWQHIQQEIKPENGRRPVAWWLLSAALLLLTVTGIIVWQKLPKNTPVTLAQKLGASSSVSSTKPASNTLPSGKNTPANQETLAPLKKLKIVPPAANFQITKQPARAYIKTERIRKVEKRRAAPEITYLITKPTNQTRAANQSKELAKQAKNTLIEATGPVAVSQDSTEVNTAKNNQPVLPRQETDLDLKATLPSAMAKADSTLLKPATDKPKEIKQREPESWTLGILFAPRYAYRRFSPNAQDDILITDSKNSTQPDAARLGYEYGMSFSRPLTSRLFLEAGISWLDLKENVSYSYTTGQIDSTSMQTTIAADGSAAVSINYKTQDRQLHSHYQYGGVRFGATYYFRQNNRSRFNLTAAAGANLLVKGRTKQFINGIWTETIYFPSKENVLEQSNYNLLFGMGYNTRLPKSLELMVMPTVNYFLGSTFINREPFGLRPYSVGLTLQVKKVFNKK